MAKAKKGKHSEVIILSEGSKVSQEPMSLATAVLSFSSPLEMNIYHCILNRIKGKGIVKERNLFATTFKVYFSATDIGEKHFQRVSAALNNVLGGKVSMVNHRYEHFKALVPLIGAEYSRYSGQISISLNPELVDEFVNMVQQGYSNYSFQQILSLKKYFSKRLYEILSGKRKLNGGVWEVEVNNLKKLLSAERYQNGVFFQRALRETQPEFEEKNVDIRFTYELVKGAKERVEHIVFTITKNKNGDGLDEKNTIPPAEIQELTAAFEAWTSEQRNAAVITLLGKDYTFSSSQVDEILCSPAKMALFFTTHHKIKDRKDVKHRTRYMAAVLGFKDRVKT